MREVVELEDDHIARPKRRKRRPRAVDDEKRNYAYTLAPWPYQLCVVEGQVPGEDQVAAYIAKASLPAADDDAQDAHVDDYLAYWIKTFHEKHPGDAGKLAFCGAVASAKPVSTSGIEGTFSKARGLLPDDRMRMKPETLQFCLIALENKVEAAAALRVLIRRWIDARRNHRGSLLEPSTSYDARMTPLVARQFAWESRKIFIRPLGRLLGGASPALPEIDSDITGWLQAAWDAEKAGKATPTPEFTDDDDDVLDDLDDDEDQPLDDSSSDDDDQAVDPESGTSGLTSTAASSDDEPTPVEGE
jgi:hypothetical protein